MYIYIYVIYIYILVIIIIVVIIILTCYDIFIAYVHQGITKNRVLCDGPFPRMLKPWDLWDPWLKVLARGCPGCHMWRHRNDVAVCQNPCTPVVHIKIAGKWMFIPLKMVLIGIDPYPCGFPTMTKKSWWLEKSWKISNWCWFVQVVQAYLGCRQGFCSAQPPSRKCLSGTSYLSWGAGKGKEIIAAFRRGKWIFA